ncbi:MAG: hypothetical protein JXA58_06300 [Dehalococcoidia bacterium]|nr:hypothetical protein [Dehalococcoidia bacterium]
MTPMAEEPAVNEGIRVDSADSVGSAIDCPMQQHGTRRSSAWRFVAFFARPLLPWLWAVEPTFLLLIARLQRRTTDAGVVPLARARGARTKDTVFIMGSGYSINDLRPADWQHIRDTGDVFSFNHFYRGRFLPITYHACGEIGSIAAPNYGTVLFSPRHRRAIVDYYNATFANPLYEHTIFFLRYRTSWVRQAITTAIWALFFARVFRGRQVCLYGVSRTSGDQLPSDDINTVSHCGATLSDVVNICHLLGYRRIVLVGIDLYDSRYFWLGPNEALPGLAETGQQLTSRHLTAEGVIRIMEVWNGYLRSRQCSLYVYNPRSLLSSVLPIYRPDE